MNFWNIAFGPWIRSIPLNAVFGGGFGGANGPRFFALTVLTINFKCIGGIRLECLSTWQNKIRIIESIGGQTLMLK